MASVTDVLNVLRTNIVSAIYPNGLLNPSTAGVAVTVISGWPIRNKIDQILKAGNALVCVYPTHKVKVVTKFERVYQPVSQADPTLTATVYIDTVTIGGTVTIPQVVTVIYNDVGYSYQVLDTDTLDTIASSLAALIPGATSLGAVITTDNPYRLKARIGVEGISAYELSRQERVFLIRSWSNSPEIRDNLINPIDIYFKQNYKIVLPDGFYGITWPMEAPDVFMDDWEKSLMVIGDLEYKVQYATTQSDEFTTITQTIQNLQIVPEIT